MQSESKRCSKCAETKPLEMFSPNRRSRDGRQARCKACDAASKAEKYRNDPGYKARVQRYQQSPGGREAKRRGQERYYWSTRGQVYYHAFRRSAGFRRRERDRYWRETKPGFRLAHAALLCILRRVPPTLRPLAARWFAWKLQTGGNWRCVFFGKRADSALAYYLEKSGRSEVVTREEAGYIGNLLARELR